MKKTIERLKKSKAHRAAFVASEINIGIPFQIRSLRKQREWDQKRLANEAGMLQPRISAMEKPGYGNLTLETLKRLAAAFDVALIVRFAPFSELIRWSDRFSPDDFNVLGFQDELSRIDSSGTNVLAFNCLVAATNAGSSSITETTRTDYVEQQRTTSATTIAQSELAVSTFRQVA